MRAFKNVRSNGTRDRSESYDREISRSHIYSKILVYRYQHLAKIVEQAEGARFPRSKTETDRRKKRGERNNNDASIGTYVCASVESVVALSRVCTRIWRSCVSWRNEISERKTASDAISASKRSVPSPVNSVLGESVIATLDVSRFIVEKPHRDERRCDEGYIGIGANVDDAKGQEANEQDREPYDGSIE